MCAPTQRFTYGISRQEPVAVNCFVDSDPIEVSFRWAFNSSEGVVKDISEGLSLIDFLLWMLSLKKSCFGGSVVVVRLLSGTWTIEFGELNSEVTEKKTAETEWKMASFVYSIWSQWIDVHCVWTQTGGHVLSSIRSELQIAYQAMTIFVSSDDAIHFLFHVEYCELIQLVKCDIKIQIIVNICAGFSSTSGGQSTLLYKPLLDDDFGSLLCWAQNSVGAQREPCIFSLITAGNIDRHRCY